MKNWAPKLSTAVAVAATVFAYAGNARATQTLAVSGPANSLTITMSQADTDRQPAKVEIYVPSSYGLQASGTPGTTIGTASGDVILRDQANIEVPLTGYVLIDDPAKHTSNSCSPGNNLMVLVLQLAVAGKPFDLPVYINPTSSEEAGLGSLKLVACLDPSDTPVGSPSHAPFGAQLKMLKLTTNNLFVPPSTTTRWESFWTPYADGTGLADVAGVVEARAFVGSGKITLSGRITNKARRIVALSGRVTFAGLGIGTTSCQETDATRQCPVTIQMLLDGELRFTIKAALNGAYRIRLLKDKNKKKYPVATTLFQAKTTVTSRDMTSSGCASPAVSTVPCVSATASAFTAISRKIKIRI